MKKDTLTMHEANKHMPVRGAGPRPSAALGLAVALMALPAAGQGAVSVDTRRSVAPVVLSSDAAPAVRPEQAALPGANAQEAQKATPEPVASPAPDYPAVGDATRKLLALQRGGQIASPVPRPVPGEVAQRSRERYLKSFEREIPERFQSSVSQKPASQ